jgi:hypothetical protein
MVLMRPVYDANNEKQRGYIKFYKVLFLTLNSIRALPVKVVYFFLDFDKYLSIIIAIIAIG